MFEATGHICNTSHIEAMYFGQQIVSCFFFLSNFILCRHGVNKNSFEELDEFKNQSVVYVGVNGSLAGLIYVEDQIREDAAHVVNALSKQGIDVYLLSGDKKSSAEYVASVVGISKDKVN